VGADRAAIFVLCHNGRDLLAECLPSVVAAAAQAPWPCPVVVVDNASTDGSAAFVADRWPAIEVDREPNEGLASFNRVLARRSERYALLLNSDVKLGPTSIEPLIATIEGHDNSLFAAPQCWTFDGSTYEGMRTRVRQRFGLVQGLCRVPGHEKYVGRPDLTASAGPVLAVDRERFLTLGGYDRLYWPGRLEDLDLGFRGWMAGWRGYYVPESMAYHQGAASFGPAFGRSGCDRLALRNTLLFCWKNLRGRRLAAHLAWLPIRLAHAVATGRSATLTAIGEALDRLDDARAARRSAGLGPAAYEARQEAFFRQFSF